MSYRTKSLMIRYARFDVNRTGRHVIAALASQGRTTNTHHLEDSEATHILELLTAEEPEGAF